jgi:hypothetical protein
MLSSWVQRYKKEVKTRMFSLFFTLKIKGAPLAYATTVDAPLKFLRFYLTSSQPYRSGS